MKESPGKLLERIKQLDETTLSAENYSLSHTTSSAQQAFPSFFLRNLVALVIQQLLYKYRTIKVIVSTPCVYIHA